MSNGIMLLFVIIPFCFDDFLFVEFTASTCSIAQGRYVVQSAHSIILIHTVFGTAYQYQKNTPPNIFCTKNTKLMYENTRLEVFAILFRDYLQTKRVYHVVTITDLDDVLRNGIRFDDKATYKNKYYDFHKFFDDHKPKHIPDWVVRSKAIFASMNFKPEHSWHSHSAILSLKINEDLCWICNENIANFLYEPLILQNVKGFEAAAGFIKQNGQRVAEDYWNCSLSFNKNLEARNDKKTGYDAEVLILHDILPKDIELLYIASDHRCMEADKWKESFISSRLEYAKC